MILRLKYLQDPFLPLVISKKTLCVNRFGISVTKVSGLGKNLCSARVWGAFNSHCKTLPTEAGVDGNSNVAVLKTGFHFPIFFTTYSYWTKEET